jgi:hypothetical protein
MTFLQVTRAIPPRHRRPGPPRVGECVPSLRQAISCGFLRKSPANRDDRHEQFRHPAERRESSGMGADPVGQRLGPARLGVDEIGGAQDGDENLRCTNLAGEPVDYHRHRVARYCRRPSPALRNPAFERRRDVEIVAASCGSEVHAETFEGSGRKWKPGRRKSKGIDHDTIITPVCRARFPACRQARSTSTRNGCSSILAINKTSHCFCSATSKV